MIETKELTPRLWPELEKLFGSNGACGGCWCMFWRAPRGEKWDRVKGAVNRRRFKRLVETGRAHGVLAFVDGEPVGWCSFDRRQDFDKLDRSPSFSCSDAGDVWSIPCFFVKSGHRGRGVATALLAAALKALQRRGAKIVEGYPVKGNALPAAFAWTGTLPLFRGFKAVGRRDGGKQRVRRTL